MNVRRPLKKRQVVRILIADTFKLFGETCRTVFEPEFEVVGVVTDASEISGAAARLRPSVIVADAEMPRIDGLRSVEKSEGESSCPKVVMLTERFGSGIAIEHFRRGASAVVSKQCEPNELLRAVRFANAGKYYVSPNITPTSVASLLREGASCKRQREITDRQQQIVRLLAHGMIAKEIAYSLGVSQGTVYFHKNRVMSALNIRSNSELFRYAMQQEVAVETRSEDLTCTSMKQEHV